MTSGPGPETIRKLVDLGSVTPAETVTADYDVHGVSTRVVTNSRAIAAAIERFLQPFKAEAAVAESSSGPDISVHLFAVDALSPEMSPRDGDAEMLYNWGTLKVYHDGPRRYAEVDTRARMTADVDACAAAGFTREALLDSDWPITNLFFYPLWAQMLKVKGLFPLHAAGLCRGDRSALFLGRSGSGKSTLSISLVKGGYGILSDDTVFLREKGGRLEALAFPEEINVREETIRLLPDLSRVRNFNMNELRQKSSFSIEELYPGSIAESSQPVVMAFTQVADSETTTAEPMSGTEALSQSLRYGFFFLDPSTNERHFYIMSMLARQARCFRLRTGRDQDGLVRVVDGLLAEAGQGDVSSEEGKG